MWHTFRIMRGISEEKKKANEFHLHMKSFFGFKSAFSRHSLERICKMCLWPGTVCAPECRNREDRHCVFLFTHLLFKQWRNIPWITVLFFLFSRRRLNSNHTPCIVFFMYFEVQQCNGNNKLQIYSTSLLFKRHHQSISNSNTTNNFPWTPAIH